MSAHVIDVKILGRIYQIKCPPEEAMQLQESAACLDEQMRKMGGQTGNTSNSERLAIVAALNAHHELMMFKRQKNAAIDVMNDRIKILQRRIQKFLGVTEEATADSR